MLCQVLIISLFSWSVNCLENNKEELPLYAKQDCGLHRINLPNDSMLHVKGFREMNNITVGNMNSNEMVS